MLVVNPLGTGVGLIAPLLNALSRAFDVVTWESRGTVAPGKATSDVPALRPSDHVRDVEQLCARLGIRRIDHVVGFCSGGEIAALLATSRGLQPRTVTFAASSQRLPDTRRTAYQATILPICDAIVRRGISAHEAVYAALSRSLADADSLDLELNRTNLQPFTDPETMLLYAHSIRYLMTELEPEKLRETVREIRVPTLILHARDDEMIHYDAAVALHREIEQSRLVLYGSGGHFLFHRAPRSIEHVLQFMSSAPPGRG